MARAKRFDRDRAEARRRHRATLAGKASPADSDAEDAGTTAEASARPAPPPARRPGQPRMGMIAAARTAYRRVELRQDLRKLPALVIHRALWIPILISLGSTVLFIFTGPTQVVGSFLFNIFGLPPAMASVFVAGFFAPTAGWLFGGVVGLSVAIFYGGFVLVAAGGDVPDVPAIGGETVPALIANGFVVGPLYGVVLAAAAAWYRRFLYLSSPARRVERGGGKGGGQRAARSKAKGR